MTVHSNHYWLDRPNISFHGRWFRVRWTLDDGRVLVDHGMAWTAWGAQQAVKRAIRRYFS